MEPPSVWKELLACLNANRVEYIVVGLFFLGREVLIKNKKATGRPRDLFDVATLEELD